MKYQIIAFGYLALGGALVYIWLMAKTVKVVIEGSTHSETKSGADDSKEVKADFSPTKLQIVN